MGRYGPFTGSSNRPPRTRDYAELVMKASSTDTGERRLKKFEEYNNQTKHYIDEYDKTKDLGSLFLAYKFYMYAEAYKDFIISGKSIDYTLANFAKHLLDTHNSHHVYLQNEIAKVVHEWNEFGKQTPSSG